MRNSAPDWMKILPVSANKLSFNELRNFKEFHGLMNGHDLADDAPESVKYAHRSFRFLYMFAMALIHEKRFPALNRCWDDLRSRYSHESIFEDGVAAESWIFFNFPITKDRRTVLDEFEDFAQTKCENATNVIPFIKAARTSRLGLYEETLSTSRVTKFRELFTDQVISTIRSVPDYRPGEIFLGRIIEMGSDRFLFGDPTGFPGERKQSLIFMVTNKMAAYGTADSLEENYEQFMRLSGPYWMSVISDDENGEILTPDHWMRYLA